MMKHVQKRKAMGSACSTCFGNYSNFMELLSFPRDHKEVIKNISNFSKQTVAPSDFGFVDLGGAGQ